MSYAHRQSVKVQLKNEWMGYPAGTVINVWKHVADYLLNRKVAFIVEDKLLDVPTQDKMMRCPTKKKSFDRTKLDYSL